MFRTSCVTRKTPRNTLRHICLSPSLNAELKRAAKAADRSRHPGVDRSRRTQHGAPLDAELLAAVYVSS
jgi:hypothetical protein